ncbi:MAG: type 1 pili tip component [Oleiphilus sp.]|nr:MAG: type 1 pili tip component [Oleiphilus sp.]
MRIKALANHWEKQAKATLTSEEYSFRLPLEDAAKIAALAEMYPKRTKNEILGELVSAALEELETNFPYIQGSRVTEHDEMGDPIYEDIGPTPRFLDLCKKYHSVIKKEQKAANS